MRYHIKDLEKGLNTFTFVTNKVELELEELDIAEFNIPIDIELEIYKENMDKFHITGTIKTKVDLLCSLCAKDYDCTIETNFELHYLRYYESGEDLTPEDLITFRLEGYEIDLSERIRETLILEIPLKPLCKKECKGLCPTCGIDLNVESCECDQKEEVDPRWSALKELKSEMEG